MDETGHKRLFVVGLGNPGRKYIGTRHNVGFVVLDVLIRRWGLGEGKNGFEGLTWQVVPAKPAVPETDGGAEAAAVTILKPMTWMNCSGRSVSSMLKFYKTVPERMLVVLDDSALPTGKLRCRKNGSSGGHNGLDDIIRACGTEEIPRLRIGIGQPPGQMDLSDYVLGRFGKSETEIIDVAAEHAADAVEDWIFGDIERVMEKYNQNS